MGYLFREVPISDDYAEQFRYAGIQLVKKDTGRKKEGKLHISHRSTDYPCCLPTLGDSPGAGRMRLARLQR